MGFLSSKAVGIVEPSDQTTEATMSLWVCGCMSKRMLLSYFDFSLQMLSDWRKQLLDWCYQTMTLPDWSGNSYQTEQRSDQTMQSN